MGYKLAQAAEALGALEVFPMAAKFELKEDDQRQVRFQPIGLRRPGDFDQREL